MSPLYSGQSDPAVAKMSSRDKLFAELSSTNQQRLFGYILALVRNVEDAHDILQETTITSWKRFDDFQPGTDFAAWTIAIARYETLNFVKYRRRHRVYFSQELMAQLGDDFCEIPGDIIEARRNALENCLSKLSKPDRKLIECRYLRGLGSKQMSELLDRSQASICNSLRRIRESLRRCVERTIVQEN